MHRLSVGLLLLLAACADPPQEVAPALALQVGDRWQINEKTVTQLAMPDGAQMRRYETRESIHWQLEVESGSEEGGWDVTLTWMDVSRPAALSWDQDVDKVLKGEQIRFHLSRYGEVSDVRGLEPLQQPVQTVLAANEQLQESEAVQPVQEFYANALSPAGIAGQFERIFRVFPPEPIMTGTEWTLPAITLPHQDFALTRVCSASIASDNIIDITFHGDVKDQMQETDSLQHGEATGTARVNVETGQLQEVSRELTVNADSSAGRSEYTESTNITFAKLNN